MNKNKIIGILTLCAWIPFVLGMAFPDAQGNSGWYTVTGFMWAVFATWSAILLLKK